jgi:hypothetical protein
MTTQTMSARPGAFLLSEAPGSLSRESIVVAASAGNLEAGTVLGKIAAGAAASAVIAGTGNATISSIVVAPGVAQGVYSLRAVSATKLWLFGPDGKYLGQATAGTAATIGGLTFTVTVGGTGMVAGDLFAITVASGAGTYKVYDDDNTDGSDVAAGVLFAGVDASSAAQDAVIIARLAEVDAAQLIWGADNDAGDKTAGLADLAALNIIARS